MIYLQDALMAFRDKLKEQLSLIEAAQISKKTGELSGGNKELKKQNLN